MDYNSRFAVFSGVFAVILAISVALFPAQQKNGEKKGPMEANRCHNKMGEYLCKADQKNSLVQCAKKLPENERKVAMNCTKRMASRLRVDSPKTWDEVLRMICTKRANPTEAQRGINLVFCFDNSLNETLQRAGSTGNDRQYPVEHFRCRNEIIDKAINALDIPCKIQLQGLNMIG